ncbi:ATP-binding cassette domain-containing protein [Nocardia sp. CA2R105]|uniref:ATP-binding cassette domain-containing protein n=1 Tax=Nocardia coffeae TaxID=2873381 RepID=UPI001CA627A8|nr:ATP-binding cassette domain-containing protein [Nocardia coffeae]MBY8859015.1 ATP-binding cassette domain-containing protein [Nocardia coffeae]
MSDSSRTPAISVSGLRKSYGEQIVLDGIDLTVPQGTIFSLLGPNGAGKTTTVQILSTLIRADAGEARVGGHDVAADPGRVRTTIGVTGQFSAVDDLLTGRENLLMMGDLYHLPRAENRRIAQRLLEQFDLVDAADKTASGYSGGMTRRLDLAMTLVGGPRIIFLDEPTTGLDPRSRRAMWDIIRELVAGGVTIFLTTQYLDEADDLAHRIAVLDHGRIVAEGTPDQLKRLVPGGHIRLSFTDRAELGVAADLLGGVADELTLAVPSDGSVKSLRTVLDRLDQAGIEPGGLAVHTPDLDDVFLSLTGQPTPEKETAR